MENKITNTNQLVEFVKQSGLEKTKADYMLENFTSYFKLASEWEKRAKEIEVTDVSQTDLMKMARVGRLALRDKRINLEKERVRLKEQSKREGKAIDGIANVLKALIIPIEKYLDAQEHFIEYKKAEEERLIKLAEEKKAEEERLLKEKKEREEQERIRLENEKLKRQAEEKERQLARERRQAEAKQREQEEKAKEEKIKAEARLEAERIKAEKKQRQARIEREQAEAKLKKKAEAEKKAIEIKAKRERDKARQKRIELEIELRLKDEKAKAEKEKLEKHIIVCPNCGFKINKGIKK